MRMAYLRARADAGDRGSHAPDVVARIRTLYEAGSSQRQIAAQIGCSRGAIAYIMTLNQIVARRPEERQYPRGAQHANWKGDGACYERLHQRVVEARGAPKRCEGCGLADPRRHYDWANLTGRYGDPMDYRRLCRPCHRRYDASRRAR